MSSPDAIVLVYVPVPGPETGKSLASAAVERGLAACGNILPGMTSVYPWEGRLESSAEALLILKTTAVLGPALEAFLVEAHPYDCPCVLQIPASRVNPGYGGWVRQQLPPQDGPRP
jgi:periplasmic divalent cation tolerance protein